MACLIQPGGPMTSRGTGTAPKISAPILMAAGRPCIRAGARPGRDAHAAGLSKPASRAARRHPANSDLRLRRLQRASNSHCQIVALVRLVEEIKAMIG